MDITSSQQNPPFPLPPSSLAMAVSINQSSGGGGSKSTDHLKPPEQGLKCPRCGSPKTKFCYYNNYSLSQPRHFCKTCRRYWTNGGSLRSVPLGGGCRRKHKKIRSNSRLSCSPKNPLASSSSEASSLSFRNEIAPSAEFNLGGFPFSYFSSAISTINPTWFETDPSASCSSLMGFGYLDSPHMKQLERVSFNGGFQEVSAMNNNGSVIAASSIGSVMNQDVHWRLEESHQKESSISCIIPDVIYENQVEKPEPLLFQNLEMLKPDASGVGGNVTTEWFLENSSCTPNTFTNTINSGEEKTSNWSGIQAWNELHQYGTLP